MEAPSVSSSNDPIASNGSSSSSAKTRAKPLSSLLLRCCCCSNTSPPLPSSSTVAGDSDIQSIASQLIPCSHHGFASVFLTSLLRGLPLPYSIMQHCIRHFENIKDIAVFSTILATLILPSIIAIGLLTVPRLAIDLPLLLAALLAWILFSIYSHCKSEGRFVFALSRHPRLLGLPPSTDRPRHSLPLSDHQSSPFTESTSSTPCSSCGGGGRFHEDSWCTVSSSVSCCNDDVVEVVVRERRSLSHVIANLTPAEPCRPFPSLVDEDAVSDDTVMHHDSMQEEAEGETQTQTLLSEGESSVKSEIAECIQAHSAANTYDIADGTIEEDQQSSVEYMGDRSYDMSTDAYSTTSLDHLSCFKYLIGNQMLLHSTDALTILQELLTRHALDADFITDILTFSLRCDVAPVYWDLIQHHIVHKTDAVEGAWYELYQCRRRWGMHEEAYQLFKLCYCFRGLDIPAGKRPERADAQALVEEFLSNDTTVFDIPALLMQLDDGACDEALGVLSNAIATKREGSHNRTSRVEARCTSSASTVKLTDCVWARMMSRACTTAVSYGLVVHLYCLLDQPVKAFNILMEDNPQTHTFLYEEILHLALNQSLELAWPVLDQLIVRDWQADKTLSVALVKLLRASSPSSESYRKRLLHTVIDYSAHNFLAPIRGDVELMGILVEYCLRTHDLQRLNRLAFSLQLLSLSAPPNAENKQLPSADSSLVSFAACTLFIRAYGRLGALKELEHLWGELTHLRRLIPSKQCCMAMLEALASNGRIKEGVAILDELAAAGVDLNAAFYAVLIRGCGGNPQSLQIALSLYYSMRARGVFCNEVTYNTLINTCVLNGDLVNAEGVYADMISSANCRPDVVTYSTLIKGWCSAGRLDRALTKFQEMQSRGVAADTIVFNTLLEGTSRKQDVALAEVLLREMRKNGIAASSHTLTILIKLYGRARMLDRVFVLVEELPARHEFALDAYVYTALISACLINRQTSAALEVFAAMNRDPHMRSKVTSRIYGTVVVGCLKAQQPFRAFHFVAEAEERGLSVNAAILRQVRLAILRNGLSEMMHGSKEHTIAQVEEVASAVSRWLLARERETSDGNKHIRKSKPPMIPAWMLQVV